jgi:uncharacterized membrane-anchored protein YitT (DUF2179 family)
MSVVAKTHKHRTPLQLISAFLGMALGTLLVAISLKCFLAPHQLIDGGIVGVSMICASLLGQKFFPYVLVLLNLPFVFLAFKQVGRSFVVQMAIAVALLAGFSCALDFWAPSFEGDVLEVIVFGGITLGIGCGLTIRAGGAVDGTEILAIILSQKRGYTVGQVIFFFNIFIFGLSGFVEGSWHPALRSFMTYIVAYKIMDTVIVGLDETKSVMIISSRPKAIADLLISRLGLGVTIMYGRGGYTGEEKEILYAIVERLQLAQLKAVVHLEDPSAFIAIDDLHEVIGGKGGSHSLRKRQGLLTRLAGLVGLSRAPAGTEGSVETEQV